MPKRVLLACASIGVALGLGEASLRVALRAPPPLAVQWSMPADAVSARAGKPGALAGHAETFDRDGLRQGSGLPFDQSVLFLGDSFTEGLGVSDDDTFARATERALRARGLAARSLNAGHRGFGASQALHVLRHMLGRVAVDAVVVQSFPMNDVSDDIVFGGFALADGRLVERNPPREPWRARLSGLVARTWLRRSYLACTASNALSVGEGAAPYDSPSGLALEHALHRELFAVARARHLPVVALVVPTAACQGGAPAGAPREPRGEIARFEAVRADLRATGAPVIDAGEVIADLAADAAKSDGGHFSAEGNARIGAALAELLDPLLRTRAPARPSR